MPTAVRIEGMLEAVSVAFDEEVEDVTACFVPDWIASNRPSVRRENRFYGIINMVIIV